MRSRISEIEARISKDPFYVRREVPQYLNRVLKLLSHLPRGSRKSQLVVEATGRAADAMVDATNKLGLPDDVARFR